MAPNNQNFDTSSNFNDTGYESYKQKVIQSKRVIVIIYQELEYLYLCFLFNCYLYSQQQLREKQKQIPSAILNQEETNMNDLELPKQTLIYSYNKNLTYS